MATLRECWDDLDAPWRAAFRLAWDGLAAGSPPIGAVITDGGGQIVSTGRSRRCEPTAPRGQLAGSNLAHAEVNALAQLAPGEYADHILHTTLEPCLLCTAAVTHCHVGTVRYAAPDPLWSGIRGLPALNEHVERRWPAWEGPMSGPFVRLSSTLVAHWHLVHRPEHPSIAALGRDGDVALQLAQRIGPALVELEGMSFDDALGSLEQLLDA